MRIAVHLPYAESVATAVELLPQLHEAGAQMVLVPEAYSFDAVSIMGYIAAKAPGMEIGSDILPLFSRTPTLLAMTAASLDQLTGGRFTLGLGASGPQVIEGFHGVPYHAPVGRTRDTIEICRKVWRRERVQHESPYHQLPLSAERGGSGLGKALKLINHPVREHIPIMVAGMGPRNVEMIAELADAWAPFFVRPDGFDEVFGAALRAGTARRDPALAPLQIVAPATLAIGAPEQTEPVLDGMRGMFALYIGGMGAPGKNFYHDLATRYGYGKEADLIQELYLSGRKDEAAAVVPPELLRSVSLVGDEQFVRHQLQALRSVGVSTLALWLTGASPQDSVAAVRALRALVDELD